MSLSVGLIGCGRHGEYLLQACRRIVEVEVRSIYDLDRRAAATTAARFGVAAADSCEELLTDRSIDAVLVATPPEAHREQCLAALANGKHVFVEKPLADSMEAAHAITAAAEASDRLVMVDHCERFDPAFIDAKHIAETGRIGELRAVSSTRLSPLHLNNTQWRLGVLTTAVHNLDLICWLMESVPTAVSARTCRVNPDLKIYDNVWISLEFPGGRRAEDHIAWLPMEQYILPVAHPRFLIMGTDGFYHVDLWHRAGMLYRNGVTRYTDDVLLGASKAYLATMSQAVLRFVQAVARGEQSPVPASVGLAAVRIALAGRASVEADGARVSLEDVD